MSGGAFQNRGTLAKAAGVFAVAVSFLFSGAAAAQVYKCRGDDGRAVYSDARCGTGEERTEVDVRDNVIETSDDAKRVRSNLTQLEKEAAAGIATTAAQNILKVKKLKGLFRTVVLPYDPSLVPNGAISSVSHDWANMQTTVKYRIDGEIPDFAVPASAAGISDGVSGRNAGRRTRPMTGTVDAVEENGKVWVTVNGMTYPCSTKLVNIGVGDSVLVSFNSGNSVHGHIVERM